MLGKIKWKPRLKKDNLLTGLDQERVLVSGTSPVLTIIPSSDPIQTADCQNTPLMLRELQICLINLPLSQRTVQSVLIII